MANAASMAGSSQVWRPDGVAAGGGGWGDVGTLSWNDDGQERDPLSDNDDHTSDDDDDSSDYEGDYGDDDFADVPYVPIADGLPSTVFSAAPFYPGGR